MIGQGVSSRSSHSDAAGRTTSLAKPCTQSRTSFWSWVSSSENVLSPASGRSMVDAMATEFLFRAGASGNVTWVNVAVLTGADAANRRIDTHRGRGQPACISRVSTCMSAKDGALANATKEIADDHAESFGDGVCSGARDDP